MLTLLLIEFVTILCLIILSISARAALEMVGQRWVTTFAHTATLTALPIITYVITKVISGNIALSLGMVGALSIVRFRNPVKSPFELSVYFAAITMGIVASASLKWLAVFVVAIILVVAALVIASNYAPRFTGRPFFDVSFSEGSRLSTLDVESQQPLPALENSEHLISESRRNGTFVYILASDKFSQLQDYMRQLTDNESVVEARLNK